MWMDNSDPCREEEEEEEEEKEEGEFCNNWDDEDYENEYHKTLKTGPNSDMAPDYYGQWVMNEDDSEETDFNEGWDIENGDDGNQWDNGAHNNTHKAGPGGDAIPGREFTSPYCNMAEKQNHKDKIVEVIEENQDLESIKPSALQSDK